MGEQKRRERGRERKGVGRREAWIGVRHWNGGNKWEGKDEERERRWKGGEMCIGLKI